MRRLILLTCLSCLTALAAAGAACGDSNSSPIATESPFRSPPSAVTQTPGAGGGAPNGTAAAPIRITASGIKYDQAQLMAAPGAIKIEFFQSRTCCSRPAPDGHQNTVSRQFHLAAICLLDMHFHRSK